MKHQQPGMPLKDCPETLEEAKGMIEWLNESRGTLAKENAALRGNDVSWDSTPRTDDAIKEVLQSGPHQKVRADFARQLERELNAVKATLHDCLRGKSV